MPEPSLFDPDVYTSGCPYERFARLQDDGGISWQDGVIDPSSTHPNVLGGWWVHRYDDVKAILRNPRTFSSQRGSVGLIDLPPEQIELTANMFINMDPPMHSSHRRLVSVMFSAPRIAALEPRIREIARSVVDEVAERGECDAVADLASRMPMQVIAELLGIPERAEQLFAISNKMIGAVAVDDRSKLPELSAEASAEILFLGLELAQERRANPDGSVVSAYLNGTLPGAENESCTDAEFGWFLLLLAIAGNETVRTATAQAIRVLADHPDQLASLLDDLDGRLEPAIEEILRFRPPVRAVRRTTVGSVDVAGVPMDDGAKVVCHLSAALRDPKRFDEPDRFDILRPPQSTQLAFGYGEHYCLGASLARLQLRTILRELYTRLPDIRPADAAVLQLSPQLEGLIALPVVFTPESLRT